MIYLAGHSLGAAHAALAAFSRVKRGLHVDGVYMFGCPNPGDQGVAQALTMTPLLSLRNRRDPITAVPFNVEFLDEDYDRVTAFTEVNEPPPPLDLWGLLADHHSELYAAAAARMARTQAPVGVQEAAIAMQDLYNGVGTWSWTNFIDGQYWAVRTYPSGAKLAIARGSVTALDWVEDFDFVQVGLHGARVSQGFWAGVAPVEAALDAVL